jgi:hypothetical protein
LVVQRVTTPQWSDGAETNPVADLFNVPLEPSTPPHQVPNHHATVDGDIETPKPASPFRERFLKNKDKTTPVRDTRPAKSHKMVPNKPGQFVEPLTDFYNTVALVLMPFKPEVSMTIIGPSRPQSDEEVRKDIQPPTVAENCARAWDEGAQRSESLRRVLDGFLTVGVVGTIIAAHTPIIMAIAGDKLNPAAAMEAMLRREAKDQA